MLAKGEIVAPKCRERKRKEDVEDRERREPRGAAGYCSSVNVARIHVRRNASGGEVLPDQPLCAIPVEVGGGVSDTGQVDTGWRESEREREIHRERERLRAEGKDSP